MPILPVLLAASQLAALPAPTSRVCSAVDVVAPEQRQATNENRLSEKKALDQGLRTRPRRVPRFSARKTLDLQLRTQLKGGSGLSGNHLLHLKLYTPRGYLYQTITVPFHRQPRQAERRKAERRNREALDFEPSRVVPGFPRVLDVQRTKRVREGEKRFDQVTARLPVAGTSITLGSLFGRWTVVPFLDDGTAPCGRSRRFVIRE